MYSSNNVQFQVYCQSFHTARSLKVTQLISVFCMYKVLIGLFTTKPSNNLSGNTNIGFKCENNKTTDLTALEKFHYFFSCHDLPAVCLGCCLRRCYPSLGTGLSSIRCPVWITLGGLIQIQGSFPARPFVCECHFNLQKVFPALATLHCSHQFSIYYMHTYIIFVPSSPFFFLDMNKINHKIPGFTWKTDIRKSQDLRC